VSNLSPKSRFFPKMRRFLLPLACAALASGGLRADVIISEFLADNDNGIEDEDGTREDWIELFNTGTTAVNLDGWWLTDDPLDNQQWRIPAVSIPANGTLLIWASAKNRVNPAAPLHTNFSLSKSGGSLGLYYPHPSTGAPVRSDTLAATYPVQAPDVSYGISNQLNVSTLVGSGQSGRYRVLDNTSTGQTNYSGSNYAGGDIGTGLAGGWNVSPAFNDAAWTIGATGIGYDSGDGGLNPWIVGNCQTAMKDLNPSILFRRVFPVAAPAAATTYKLRMKYEDGFVAWLNGTEIARANAPAGVGYNSSAAANLDEAIVNTWTEFTIPSALVLTGNNVLAVQGLNITSGSSDFLLLPEITALSAGTVGAEVYFSPPTPNALNGTGSAGPVVYDATPADPLVPRPLGNGSSPAMKITVRVIKTKNNVSTVRAFHRTLWNAESAAITLNDAGTGADTTAADGIYSANLPTTGPASGQMFRWRFEAQDSAGTLTKLPAYASPTDSPQYFGSVAADASTATSQLPVLEWFVDGSPATGPTAAAFRGSCYYLGRFYDNIGHEIHGQSTSGFVKKSYDFDSNRDLRFVWKEGEPPVKDLNLLSNYADKTKTRNTLSHEVGKLAATPYHFAFPVRVQLNGGFHGVLDLVEDGDDRMLERNGLDGAGAFYKIYAEDLTSSPEKKTRLFEDNSDLNAMATALDPAVALATRRTYAYDNLNIPAAVNYLVVRQFNSDTDHGHKNFYLYRDTNRTREWRPIIWDVDLSQGHTWNGGALNSGGYFNDALTPANGLNSHTANDRFYNIILESPEMRDMWVRRMRTLMDQLLQPPGTVNGILETRMRAIAASVDPDPAVSTWTDGDLDATRWGFNAAFIPNRPREEVERVVSGYFGPRRTFLFNTGAGRPVLYSPDQTASTPIPASGQTNVPGMVLINSVDYLPSSGSQNQEYILLKNTTAAAVDLSGWTLDGGIDHVFEGGTVILPGAGRATAEYKGLLHVVKDAFAFRGRATGPTGGQKRLVQGNYAGQLSARGETLNLRDPAGQLIATFSYPGTPSDLQRYFRISEIQFHPASPSFAEETAMPAVTEDDFEFLEFVNIGPSSLALAGAKFTRGIGFTFPAHSLAAGARLIVAKNPAAFALRHPGVTVPVLGPYDGVLANTGEPLELTDAVGENILDFEYKDGWYPATDGSGHALVLRDPATPHDQFGDPARWAISSGEHGSPGSPDAALAQAYYGWDNFHFTSLERDDLLVSGPDADPDGDHRNNAGEYALGTDPRVADQPVLGFAWSLDGPVRRPALRFRRPAGALDVTYELLAGGDLTSWPVVSTTAAESSPLAGDVEEVIFRDSADDRGAKRFLKLRYVTAP
jgi:hypothetical protein